MDNKVNYPVVYTLMPIYNQCGWVNGLTELEPRYDLVCYIVTKSYLVKEIISYTATGLCETKYDVVYPYINLRNLSDEERKIPKYNYEGKCINAREVNKIYYDLKEAVEDKERIHEKMIKNFASLVKDTDANSDKLERVREERKEIFNKYAIIEEQLRVMTLDMDVCNITLVDTDDHKRVLKP